LESLSILCTNFLPDQVKQTQVLENQTTGDCKLDYKFFYVVTVTKENLLYFPQSIIIVLLFCIFCSSLMKVCGMWPSTIQFPAAFKEALIAVGAIAFVYNQIARGIRKMHATNHVNK
jgi:hypothetical protein